MSNSATTKVRTAVETHTGTLEWTISDVGMLPKDPENPWVESPPFTINGEPWTLDLYSFFPNSEKTDSEYIAAFVHYGGEGEVDAEFSITCGKVTAVGPLDRFTSGGGRGWPRFTKRKPLVGKEIVFTALVKVRGALTTCPETLLTPLPAPTLAPQLKRLLNIGEGSDVLVKTSAEGSDPIAAHRLILAVRSPVFAAMFTHDVAEKIQGEVLIESLPAPAVRAFLEYLYNEDLPAETIAQHAEALLAAADEYEVPRLGAVCERYMVQHLAVGNAVAWAILAYLHKAEGLKEMCLRFIQANLRALKATEAWKQLLQQPEIMNDLLLLGLQERRKWQSSESVPSSGKRLLAHTTDSDTDSSS